jgi:hypothetical protein
MDEGADGDKEKEKGGGGLLARLTAKFDQARAYSTDKMRLGFAEAVFGQVEGAAILLLGMMYVHPRLIALGSGRRDWAGQCI